MEINDGAKKNLLCIISSTNETVLFLFLKSLIILQNRFLSKKSRVNKTSKSIGLFDHIKQINQIQDPNYFDNLTESDKKSFNHFIILKGLSMNPDNLDIVNLLYRYFDIMSCVSIIDMSLI
jgi:hypothetical protein